MGDANPIRTLGDYSKPSHEGYRNTIELPEGNIVVPLRSDTIWLVQNRCSFHKLWSEDPNQHLKDFLKLVDSLDLDGANRERMHLNAKESWALLKDLALYDNESWNDLRDFAKPFKAISLPQDFPSTFDRHLIELEHQVQRLMEAYIAPMQPTQVNKITSSCEICSGPHDTQYCMENPEQAFVDYAFSRTDEMGSRQFTMNQRLKSFNEAANAWKGKPKFNWAHAQTFTSPQNGSFSTYSSNYQTKLEKVLIDFDSHQEKRLSSLRTQLGQQQDHMISKINLLWKTISKNLDDTSIQQNRNPSSSKRVHFVNSIVIQNKEDGAKEEGHVKSNTTKYKDHEMTVESEEEFEEETEEEIEKEEEDSQEHFDTFPTMKELRLHYNWIMSKRLETRRQPSNPKKICNFVGRVKGLKVFVGYFTYKCDFVVLEDTTSVIDHDLGSVVFGKPFVEATRLVYDREEGTIAFEKVKEKIVFKMPHKMEMFKHIDFTDVKTDRIPSFVIESDYDDSKKPSTLIA
ncbi:hypothetical protein Tco_1427928 [Tanacetum coccineum]